MLASILAFEAERDYVSLPATRIQLGMVCARRSAFPETLRRETKVNSRNFFAELKRRNVIRVAVGWRRVNGA
jgi:hypothetical protein